MHIIKRTYKCEDGSVKTYTYNSEEFAFSATTRTNHRWTDEDVARLKELYADPLLSVAEIADALHTTLCSVYMTARRYNLIKATIRRQCSPEEARRIAREKHRYRMLNDKAYVKRIRERGRNNYYKTHPNAKRRVVEQL